MKSIKGDAHVDSIERAFDNNLKIEDRKLQFNTFDVNEYLPYLQYMASFVNDTYIKRGYERASSILNYYYKTVENVDKIITIKNKEDMQNLFNENKLGVVLTVENGRALDGDISNIYKLYNQGVRQMTITWNFENELGAGCLSKCDTGLTNFGKKCISVMNEINMIVDVSHSSQQTLWNIASHTTKPIMASHSNAYTLCKHKRNLTDSEIKEIARLDGIIGITYYSPFVSNKKSIGINDVVNHIEYITNLVGIDKVCLGSDYDGVDKLTLPQNLKGVKDINKLEECMQYRGFYTEEIKKIMGENLFEFTMKNLK